MAFQPNPNQAYSLEDIHQVLLVIEQIQKLSLRPQKSELINTVIQQLTRLIGSKKFPVQVAAKTHEELRTLLESLTAAEMEQIDLAIGEPKIDVAVLTNQEIKQILLILEGIIALNLRPQQSQLIQFMIQQLQPLTGQEKPEILIKTAQALQIEAILNSLTAEEQKSLDKIIPQPESQPYFLTQAELNDLLSILRELQHFKQNPEIAQVAEALVPDLEKLQAQGEAEVELHGMYAAQIQMIMEELMPV
ncbi:hypothetical protein [Planktothricoides raciborskii]|uniref:Uncharacterized protein n=2 Tax=Planktothricoides raciborskii TaxID=132608 RepID=A0AAU8JK47_9CYAN|nr:hypothetical protein [Planktothricoides raciborskii]MBD2545680.1 hypothetical protein [Planktothricoides raciborskii FACHB-1370]MBD2582748.1 hypothetical protein [Planktothricoides raciborskii FACHB-1261]